MVPTYRNSFSNSAMKKNILIVGDSFSHTGGFDDPTGKLWFESIRSKNNVNNELCLDGQGNLKIFLKTCAELIRKPNYYDLVIVQWSSIFRIDINVNNTVYDNQTGMYSSGDSEIDLMYRTWVSKLTHGRIELIELLTYINAMIKFLKDYGSPFIFIKTFENHFLDLSKNKWSDCSLDYLNAILHYNEIPDWEIEKFHNDLNYLYTAMQHASKDNWLNLFTGAWKDSCIDWSDDKNHSGVETNKQFGLSVIEHSRALGINLV